MDKKIEIPTDLTTNDLIVGKKIHDIKADFKRMAKVEFEGNICKIPKDRAVDIIGVVQALNQKYGNESKSPLHISSEGVVLKPEFFIEAIS